MSKSSMTRCAFCSTEFRPGKTQPACCSVACANRLRRARPLSKNCERCGGEFAPKKTAARFCGLSCSALARVHGTEEERFWEKVEKSEGCWNWTGSLNWDGYGQLRFDGACRRANRVVWLLEKGPIPKGMQVLHECDNPRCVNPKHLFLGTHADNMRDMVRKGRWHLKNRVGH